jgi:hypothetical protein
VKILIVFVTVGLQFGIVLAECFILKAKLFQRRSQWFVRSGKFCNVRRTRLLLSLGRHP